MTPRNDKKPESTRFMVTKYNGLRKRFTTNPSVLTNFEVKMMWAYQERLTERGYFNDKRIPRPLVREAV